MKLLNPKLLRAAYRGYVRLRAVVRGIRFRLPIPNFKSERSIHAVSIALVASSVTLAMGYLFLGSYVKSEFQEKALDTVQVLKQDIQFVSSVAPIACIYERNKSYFDFDELEGIGNKLNVLTSRLVPEIYTVLKQAKPFDSQTRDLISNAKSFSSLAAVTASTVNERLSDFNKSSGIFEVLFSMTVSAMMAEEIEGDVDALQRRLEKLKTMGLRYKDTAMGRLPKSAPLSGSAQFVARHFISEEQKQEVAAELYEKIVSETRSNRLFAAYDDKKCFTKYQSELKRKIEDAVINAI